MSPYPADPRLPGSCICRGRAGSNIQCGVHSPFRELTPPAPVPPPNESVTVAELDALPEGSIVLCDPPVCLIKTGDDDGHLPGEWRNPYIKPGRPGEWRTGEFIAPDVTRVLYDPRRPDWLADLVAAAKAEERERVAAVLMAAADAEVEVSDITGVPVSPVRYDALQYAAKIARSAPSTTDQQTSEGSER